MELSDLRHHIIFVSDQNVPNALGALLPEAKKPRIHAIVTRRMTEKSRTLEKFFQKHGCPYSTYSLASITQEEIFTLLDTIEAACQGEPAGINLTGGTKLMTLAAYEWAYVHDLFTFYVDTQEEKMVLPASSRWQERKLPDILKIDELLGIYGFTIKSSQTQPVNKKYHAILYGLLDFVCTKKGENALGLLNKYASAAEHTVPCTVKREDDATSSFNDLLILCRKAGKLAFDGKWISFPDEGARFWCNGGWLEEYVQMILYQMKNEQRIKSWACSVNVDNAFLQQAKKDRHEKPGQFDDPDNEFDALFSTRNLLYTIECKTGNIKQTYTLHKSDSLRACLGGTLSRAMLCSVRDLKPKEKEWAKVLRIKVVTGKMLKYLKEELTSWSQSK